MAKLSTHITTLIESLEKLTGKKVILKETSEHPFKSAVAIIFKGDHVLLGTARSHDDRNGKLCFPGGGMNIGETPYEAAKREAWEESGIFAKCSPIAPIVHPSNPKVCFVVCNHIHGDIKHNNEFTDMAWYPVKNIPPEKIYPANQEILQSLKK